MTNTYRYTFLYTRIINISNQIHHTESWIIQLVVLKILPTTLKFQKEPLQLHHIKESCRHCGGQNGWSPRGVHQKGRDFVSSNPLRQSEIIGETKCVEAKPVTSLVFCFDVWTEGDIYMFSRISILQSFRNFRNFEIIWDNHINQPTQKIETPSGFGNTRRIRHKLSYRLDRIQLSHEKNPKLLSMESWLVNKESLFHGLWNNPYITG